MQRTCKLALLTVALAFESSILLNFSLLISTPFFVGKTPFFLFYFLQGDLDALLQDFSYLKSLEHKNKAPKKASKKLLMPHHSCMHMVKLRFKRSGEDTFERIFHRPLGQRCFVEYLKSPGCNDANPSWLLAMQFLKEAEDLKSEQPVAALEQAATLKEAYLESPIATGDAGLWADPELKAKLDERMAKLKAKADLSTGADATISKKKNLNLKEFFALHIANAKTFLSGIPYESFKASRFWVRYMQWKQLELNMIVNDRDFDVHRILGRGGFGEVFGCRKFDTGALFAMKKLDKKRLKLKEQESTAVHERNVLSEMHSKFVTKLKYSFHDKDSLYLLLDLCEGGDLNWHLQELGTFSEEQAKFYTAQIIMGLAHIHDKAMVYRDLKPANVLLTGEGNAMISDLGLVRDIKKGRSLPKSECGTHGYMAPEVLEKDREYSYPSDWFSLGCTLFQFFTGHTPFKSAGEAKGKEKDGGKGTTKEEVVKRTMLGEVEFLDDMPPLAKDLITKLLEVDPAKRLGSKPPPHGAQEIRAHPWFADMDWQALTDHKLEPLIVPHHGIVNASDVHEIERFDRDDTRKIKITSADETKYYSKFDYIMSHSWQDEVMAMFDIVTKTTDSREAAEEKRRSKAQGKASGFVEETGEECIMEGWWLKQSKVMKSWNLRYIRLYEDRLTWSNDDIVKIKQSANLDELVLEKASLPGPTPTKPLAELTIKSKADGSVLGIFRTAYLSDQPTWIELLEHAIEAAATSDPAAKARLSSALVTTPGLPMVHRQQSLSVGDHLSSAEKQLAIDRLNSDQSAGGSGGGGASGTTIQEGTAVPSKE